MCGGQKAPDYQAQAAAAKAEADKVRAEEEKARSEADAKSMADRVTQANQDSQAAFKRRLLISETLGDKSQALESTDLATKVDAQIAAGNTAEEDPLGLNKKKKTLLSANA